MIREKLIPALVGRSVSDTERRKLALPVRFGGIGPSNPVLSADLEHSASTSITNVLPMSSIAKAKILPIMTEYKLRITSNWSRHKKYRYCRRNTINYLKKLMLELKDLWYLLEKRELVLGSEPYQSNPWDTLQTSGKNSRVVSA